MRKLFFLTATILSATFSFAQTTPPPADDNTVSMANLQGLLRTQLTITPSWDVKGLFGNNTAEIAGGRTNIYLHGTLEFYFTERFSMRGDAYYFVNKDKDPMGMKHNHSLQVACAYHLRKGMGIDPYIGLCGGISLVQINPYTDSVLMSQTPDVYRVANIQPAMHIEPVWAPRIGINFFGEHVFHFFIEAQYLMGTYRPPVGPILSLNEVRVSAGLGWNWVILHKEATVRPGI